MVRSGGIGVLAAGGAGGEVRRRSVELRQSGGIERGRRFLFLLFRGWRARAAPVAPACELWGHSFADTGIATGRAWPSDALALWKSRPSATLNLHLNGGSLTCVLRFFARSRVGGFANFIGPAIKRSA